MLLKLSSQGQLESEMGLYFAAPISDPLDLSLDLDNEIKPGHYEQLINIRSSYISEQYVYDDAILASIGYKWKSEDLFHEDLSLKTYHRMLLKKLPNGSYKISREAILMADLPSESTTQANWRGHFPRELLLTFCRQHQLLEPVFPILHRFQNHGRCWSSHIQSKKRHREGNSNVANKKDSVGYGGTFRCVIKVFSKSQDLLLECSPKEHYKKKNDSVLNASLKVVSWLNEYFKELGVPLEKLNAQAEFFGINYHRQKFFTEFTPC